MSEEFDLLASNYSAKSQKDQQYINNTWMPSDLKAIFILIFAVFVGCPVILGTMEYAILHLPK